jgi:hypothetical protein
MWLHTLRGMKTEVMCIAFMKYIDSGIFLEEFKFYLNRLYIFELV